MSYQSPSSPLLLEPKTYLWPSKEKMPDYQPHQHAATTEEVAAPGYSDDDYRLPYLQWYQPPKKVTTDALMVIVSGGGYNNCCDIVPFDTCVKEFLAAGIPCVMFIYRTPRANGIPLFKTAWQDGQRAIRVLRSEAARRGYHPEKIGVIGCSAGSHLSLLLALSSQQQSYQPVDELDQLSCHIAFAVPTCPAYLLSDGLNTQNVKRGHGDDVFIDPVFAFDAKSCPCCLIHGADDPYSPIGSTKVFRRLREMGIPAEIHLEANGKHGFMNLKRMSTPKITLAFLERLGYLSPDDELKALAEWEENRQNGIQNDLEIIF